MAKGKKPSKRGGGVSIGKGFKVLGKIFDSSAQWVADHTGPKPARARRASIEWTSKPGGKGEHLPLSIQRGLAWGQRQTAADKEVWRVSFMAGPTVEFVTWPPRDKAEAERLAKEHVVKLYGVYAESWEIGVVEFARKAVEDELPEDAKA
jgi:hypothetical protein